MVSTEAFGPSIRPEHSDGTTMLLVNGITRASGNLKTGDRPAVRDRCASMAPDYCNHNRNDYCKQDAKIHRAGPRRSPPVSHWGKGPLSGTSQSCLYQYWHMENGKYYATVFLSICMFHLLIYIFPYSSETIPLSFRCNIAISAQYGTAILLYRITPFSPHRGTTCWGWHRRRD